MAHRDPQVLVLGLGNDLLADDGVGLEVVRRVSGSSDGAIECVESAETGLALLDLLSGHDKAIVVDAVLLERGRSGEVLELSLDDIGRASAFSPHSAGLVEASEIAGCLGLPFPRELRLVAIAVRDPFTIGESMSPEVVAAADRAVDRIRGIIAEWTE